MEAAIEQRLSALEERLGLPPAGDPLSKTDFDLTALRKKIIDVGCGFTLKIPSEDLKKLNDLFTQPEYVTFLEKQRAIEFGYDLMLERARLLEEFEKGSQVVDSEQWGAVIHHQPAIEAVEKELNEATDDIRQRCSDQIEMRNNFKSILRELQDQVKEWETMLDRVEKAKASESEA